MKTDEIVIRKVKAWLAESNITHQILADDLGIIKITRMTQIITRANIITRTN